MKFTIIGAGNMGSAIARGLSKSAQDYQVAVADISKQRLEELQRECPTLEISTSNASALKGADFVVFAVKPWILPGVIAQLTAQLIEQNTTIISIAGGVNLEKIQAMLPAECPLELFYVIPDTAIMVGAGMTFITTINGSEEHKAQVQKAFATMGEAVITEPRLMGAATALCSCGIAYVYKYIQASVQAGVQLGFYPDQALKYTLATVEGATKMLKQLGTLPQQEIDRVTTPGGMTIRGINELDHSAFPSAVINAILKPLQP